MADLKAFVLSCLLCLLSQCAQSLQAEAMVFVADRSIGEIFMADFSNDSLDSLTFDALPIHSVIEPMGVDYDPDNRMVYWSERSGSIRRANIDGTMQSVIANVGWSEDLALDTSRGKVFWTDRTLDRIMSANLNGSSQQILINTDLPYPRAIIVHKGEGLMFWTNWYDPSRIERANLDGGDRYVIVNSDIVYPNGLALNADSSRVYWCDSGTGKIESVDLKGNNRMIHLWSSWIVPFDLTVVDDSIIWTNAEWDYGEIGVTSTDSSSGYGLYYDRTFQNPIGIHAYREEKPTTTEVYNPTTDQANTEENVTLYFGVTKTISSPNYPSYYTNNARYHWYITAPSGYDVLVQFLDFDLEGCCDYLTIGIGESPSSPGSVQLAELTGSSLPSLTRLDSSKSWMWFTTDYSVTERGFQLQLSLINSTTDSTTSSVPTEAPSTAEAMVFVADTSIGEIFMADFSIDSLDSLTFDALPISVIEPMGVDYDPDNRMVYWTERSGSMRRANINGTMQSVIANVGWSEDLALDTSRGKVFWTDQTQDRIMAANLNGSSQQILINTDLYYPRAIIVHTGEGLMFWTDWYDPSRIERANLDGGDRYVIVNSDIVYPNGLALNADSSRVYWCDSGPGKIESVDLWGNNRMIHLWSSSIVPFDLTVVDDSIIWTNAEWDYGEIGVTSTDSSSGYGLYYDRTFQNPLGIHAYREEKPITTEVYNPTTDQANTEPTPDGSHPTTVGWWDTTRDMPIEGEENVTLYFGVTKTISSPNYPSYYTNNARYNWYITAPSDYDVLVQFLDFDLENYWDVLTIGIGESPSSPGSVQLAELTGSSLPSDMRLDSSKSWMRFTTDSSVTERGFQLQLSLINSTTDSTTSSVPTEAPSSEEMPTTTEVYNPTSDQANPAESMVFVADYYGHAIFMADFSSDSLDSLTFDALPFSSIRFPTGVDYDPDTRMVYWSEVYGSIRRANINGIMQSVIVDSSSGAGSYKIALDTSRGKVFWTDDVLDRIMSANLDGSSQQILINTDIDRPHAIIIHKGEGLMFWTDLETRLEIRIERANLDGGDRYAIVNSGITHPYGLAFNADSTRVYWCDASTKKIESVDLWGNDRTVHLNDLEASSIYPYDLAVIDDSIIWTDYYNGVLGVTSTNSSSGYSFYYDSIFQRPYGLHVYREEMPTTTALYNPTSHQANTDYTTSPILTEAPSTVRLVNGNEAHEGRVEVFHSGSWGTVCDDYWGIDDARVVCRSLGYRDALSAPSRARYGQGSGPIWMDNVNCSGIEAHIFDCPHNGFGNHDCSHGEDASVVCLPDQADLTCNSVSMTLIMDRTLLEIGDDARDVHFVDKSCVGYDHDSQHVAITTMYDGCGTTQEQDDDYIIFTNKVTYYKPRPENGTDELITRKHYLQIPVTCYLERTQVLEDSFLPEANLRVFEKKGYGDFSLNLDRYTNSGFDQPTNDSGEVTLGTPLYFGVRLTSVTNLTLLIESCCATSSPDPGDDHRYNIIEKGCAVDSTTVIYNWASPTFKGFSIDAFTFIGDNDEVYVHCSILICDNNNSGSRCAQGCISRSRRSLKNTGFQSKLHTITNGPLSDASRSQRAMLLDSVYDL